MALKTKMKTRVQDTKPVSQAHLDLSTAEIPRKMKMMVSAMLARVFMVYFTVVRDFWEMLASTYLFAPIPQKVILQKATRKCLSTVHLTGQQRVSSPQKRSTQGYYGNNMILQVTKNSSRYKTISVSL